MQELKFLVKGSAADPYEVTFIKDGDSLTAICSCPAGQYSNFCKHRISILDGNSTAVISENVGEASRVQEWLSGTDVEAALLEMRNAEKVADTAKRAFTAAKKKLARAMNS